MKYRALALDLDGTLTNSNKVIPERNIEAIAAAIDAGVTIILASGRPEFGIRPIADTLKLQEKGGYMLACNGGRIINCATGELVSSVDLPDECIDDICACARENGVYAVTYSGDNIISESDDDYYVRKEALCNYAEVIKVPDMRAYVNYKVPKFLVVGEHEHLLPVQEELLEKHRGKINAYFSESYFLEVVPEGVAKDRALEKLLGTLGIRREELAACGDGMNDIPMLEYAGLAAVMENAYPDVKKYADVCVSSNDNCGVAEAIYRYIL